MSNRIPAAVTHFVCGGLLSLSGVNGFLWPQELSPYTHYWSEFLAQYGGPLSTLVLGGGLVAVGLLTLKARDPVEGTSELNFTNEAEIPLAPVMAAFLIWVASISFRSVLPYTGERGIELGHLALSPVIFGGMMFGAWFMLHYRRVAILDSAAGVLTIAYGKPWAALSFKYPFARFQSVAIEVVERAKGKVYRLVATGAKGSKLISFTFSEESAKSCLSGIVKATGWSSGEVPALD